MSRQKLGIFGGTFDPPHLGHMILAAEAADQLALDKVLWMLAPNPPHKQGEAITAFAKRAEMVQACIQQELKFELSRLENERPGPHYSSDTLKILREIYPDDEITLLIGGDSLIYMPTWHEPQLVMERIDALGVMQRPGENFDWVALENTFPRIQTKLRMIDAPLLEISSTEIRERAASGHHFRYYLEDAVYQIIKTSRLYQE